MYIINSSTVKVNMKENYIGSISNYFSNISVAAFELESGKLKVGDTVHIKGNTTDITETVSSIQIENDVIESAKKGKQGVTKEVIIKMD